MDDGTLENRDTPRMLLPQHHYMDKIHEQFPNATFILNLRPVDAWVNSVLNWPTSLKREIPGENPKVKTVQTKRESLRVTNFLLPKKRERELCEFYLVRSQSGMF